MPLKCPDCGYENAEDALSCNLCQKVIKKEPRAAARPGPAPGVTRIPYVQIAEKLVATSTGADPYLGGLGALLNWQPSSIFAMDRFIDLTWGEKGESPGTETYGPSRGKDIVILQFGSYLGEVARRLWGGEWREDPNNLENPNWTMMAFPDRSGFFPIGKVFKRFKNGAEDSFFLLLWSLLESRPRPPGDLGFMAQAEHFIKGSHLPPPSRQKLAFDCYGFAAKLDPALQAEAEARRKDLMLARLKNLGKK